MKAKDCLYWTLAPFAWCGIGAKCLCTCIKPPKRTSHGTSAPVDRARIRLAKEEARRKDTPVALPTQRPRALTAPLPSTPEPSYEPSVSLGRRSIEHGSSNGQRTCPQTLSPFFEKLPPEIRHQIYVCVFQDDQRLVHIVRNIGQRRLGHLRCGGICFGTGGLHALCWGGTAYRAADWCPSYHGVRTDGGVLPLLRSCRKLYTEAIDTLYQSLTFAMANLETMILFSVTVLPQRLNAVRRLHLNYNLVRHGHRDQLDHPHEWKRVCGILSRMRALEELRVDIYDPFATALHPLPNEEMWGPLIALTTLKDYEVRTNWPLSNDRGYLGDSVPFRLVEWDPVKAVDSPIRSSIRKNPMSEYCCYNSTFSRG